MSAKLNAVQTESTDTIKVVEYPKELTLMSEYMNDVQAKRFKGKQSFGSFIRSGLNLTVLRRDTESTPSNIVDSGIRLGPPQCQPDAA